MGLNHKILVCVLILVLSINGQNLCPESGLSIGNTTQISENVLKSVGSSKTKGLVELKYDQAGNFYLQGYTVVNQTSNGTQSLRVMTSRTQLLPSVHDIVAVSQNGKCVAVYYLTGHIVQYLMQNDFFMNSQPIAFEADPQTFSVKVNDFCNHVIVEKALNNSQIEVLRWEYSQLEPTTQFPTSEYLVDDRLESFVDKQGNFFYNQIYGNYSVTSKYAELKSDPLIIKYSFDLSAAIVMTKDSQEFSLVAIDPTKPQAVFKKSYVKGSDYFGEMSFDVQWLKHQILLRDQRGFVDFIQLNKNGSTISQTFYTLEDLAHTSFFKPSGFFSISEDIIFAYIQKTMTYFRISQGKISLLKSFDTDIEKNAFSYRTNKNETAKSEVVVTLITPTEVITCPTQPVQEQIIIVTTSFDDISDPFLFDPILRKQIKCPLNCLKCTSSQNCSICRAGYSLDPTSYQCIPCQGCSVCSNFNNKQCYACFAPQVLDKTTSKCINPSCNVQKCLQCDLTGKCIKCVDGFGLSDSKCVQCTIKGCKKCSENADSCDVGFCKSGHVFFQNPKNKKRVCQPCAVGIETCLASDLSIAASCTMGNHIKRDQKGFNRCSKCFQNCRKCSNETNCEKCRRGYVPSADGTSCVVKCSGNCLTCDPSNPKKCLTCYGGSELDTQTNKCIGDKKCSQNASCVFCDEGFILGKGLCNKCNYTDPNCLGCLSTNLNTCSSCNLGYYLLQNTCKKCDEGCADCFGEKACAKCSDGFYLLSYENSETGSCFACDSSCLTCAGTANLCTSCSEKKTLKGSKCVSVNNVQIQLVITANVPNFIEFMIELLQWFITEANKGILSTEQKLTEDEVAITAIFPYGSSNVTASVSAVSPQNTNGVAQALNNAINTQPLVGGYQIIAGSATPIIGDPSNVATQQSSSSVGLILGIAIPVGLLLLIGVIVIGVRLSKKKSEMKEDEERYRIKDYSESEDRLKTGKL